MASITIRNLDESLKQAIKFRAVSNGKSMEEEVRSQLRRLYGTSERGETLRKRADEVGLGTALVELFAEVPGDGLEIPDRNIAPDRPL